MKRTAIILVIYITIIASFEQAIAQVESLINLGLYRPSLVGHANLPEPGIFRFANSYKISTVEPDDFFKDHQLDIVHEGHRARRSESIFSLTYGVFRNAVLIAKIPYVSSYSKGYVHPAGVTTMKLFVDGNTQAWGDASLLLKYRLWKQGDAFISLATFASITFPTGPHKRTFDQPMVVENEVGEKLVAFNGGAFTRFSDDGRLPVPIQPGSGGFAGTFGIIGTKVLNSVSAAVHLGVAGTTRQKSDDLNFGNDVTYYMAIIKGIYKDKVLLDLTVNGIVREGDIYSGQFTHPTPNADGSLKETVTTDRPSFRKGHGFSFSPGVIWNVAEGYRLVYTYSLRLNNPELGPWPRSTYQLGFSYEF